MDFYHDLAPFYDQMISFKDRLEKEREIFLSLLGRFPAKKVLDAGCGSGFHSILLEKLGVQVTGTDISKDMLNLAKNNAHKYHSKVVFLQADFLELLRVPQASFDAVYCLGNGFVHLLTEKDRIQALDNFKKCLIPNGYLCLQMINYEKFLKEKRRVLAVKKMARTTFTRTYDYHENTITFHVDIDKDNRTQRISTELYPLRQAEILSSLKKTDFKRIESYGNLNLDPFDPLLSENLCIFCS